MEVEYKIETKDVTAFYRRHFESTPSMQRSYRMGYVWLTVLALVFGTVTSAWQHWLSLTFWLVFLITCFIAYRPLVYWDINRSGQKLQKAGRNKGIWGEHKISLQENELIETSAAGESRTLWAAVERLEQNEEYIFIYTSSIAAHVIPKHSFEDKQQAERFYSTARAYYERARA